MNPKIMKLRGKIEKNKGKISNLQGRNRKLEDTDSSAWCVRTG